MTERRRRSRSTIWAALVLAALLSHCKTPAPPPPPLPTPAPTIPPIKAVSDVFDAPREVLTDAGFTITETDEEKGSLVAVRRVATATAAERQAGAAELRRVSYIEETKLLEADRRLQEYTLTVQVRIGGSLPEISVSAKTGIVVVVRAGQAKPISRPIPSRGVIEKELIEKVQKSFEE